MESFTNAAIHVGTTSTTLYTCPASTRANLFALYLSNNAPATITVDALLYDDSQADEFVVGKGLEIEPGTTLVFDKSIVLEEGDELRLIASSADCDAVASIVEST